MSLDLLDTCPRHLTAFKRYVRLIRYKGMVYKHKGVSRREFFKKGIGIGLTGGILASLPPSVRNVLGEEPEATGPDVAVVRGDAIPAVKAALAHLGGMGVFVKPGDRVVIKPNLSFANPPDRATTTDPELVRAVAQLCVEAGANRVLVMDHTIHDAKLCMDRTGIRTALEGLDKVVLFPLIEQRFFEEVEVPKGEELEKVEVAREVLRADCFIAMPIAKSHSATGISLSLKGMLGVVWDRRVFHESMELNQALADLGTVARSDLTLIDATRALQTRGPNGPGRVAKLDTIVASRDPLAADSYAVGLTTWYNRRFTGRQVKHLLNAYEMGLGEIDVERMRIKEIRV